MKSKDEMYLQNHFSIHLNSKTLQSLNEDKYMVGQNLHEAKNVLGYVLSVIYRIINFDKTLSKNSKEQLILAGESLQNYLSNVESKSIFIESLNQTKFDISPILNEAASIIANKNKVHIICIPFPEVITITGYKKQLRQFFLVILDFVALSMNQIETISISLESQLNYNGVLIHIVGRGDEQLKPENYPEFRNDHILRHRISLPWALTFLEECGGIISFIEFWEIDLFIPKVFSKPVA
jgi:hypothetical protein